MKYYLFTKGADNVMLDKINFDKTLIQDLQDKVRQDLNYYSCDGLRTLVMSMREVQEKEVKNFQEVYQMIMDSSHPQKEKKVSDLYKKMENKLRYLGCTAIEDKL